MLPLPIGSPQPGAGTGPLELPDAATAYATAGLAIFPCAPGGKTPLTAHGFKDAATDAARIEAWWRKWPTANIAIATGWEYDVLDIDISRSGTGFPAFDRARRAGLVDGWLYLIRTPSGGLHAYYPSVRDRPQNSWALGHVHVDFRAHGGYVLAPPSTIEHNGATRSYTVIASGEGPQPIDATAVRNHLRPPPPARPVEAVVRPHVDLQRIAAWLATQREGSKNRNHALFWAACRLAEQNIPQHDAVATLGVVSENAGLEPPEIDRTIASAYRNAHRRPAQSHRSQGSRDEVAL